MQGRAHREAGGEESHARGRLSGASISPRSLEDEFRAAHLRDDGRDAAVIVGALTLLSLLFVPNDLVWAAPAGRLAQVTGVRAIYLATGLAVVVVGLRARHAAWLDWAVLANGVVGSAFTIVLQSTRPSDYYLPAMVNSVWVLIAWAVVPNRFAFQALAAAALTGSCAAWVVAFRVPPPRPAVLLLVVMFVVANLSGAFLSWRLHRSRRSQFLSAREQMETAARLGQAERLAALGTLVAGVAHEVNNPLGAALASTGFVAEELRDLRRQVDSPASIDRARLASRLELAAEALEDARSGERRIASIVRDLTLLGRADARRGRVMLSRAVEQALVQLPEGLRRRVDVSVEDGGAPDVAAAEGQVVQVLVNLLSNAAHAAPVGRNVRVMVRLAPGSAGTSRVEVEDDGVGMSQDTLARIYDPFFTTREVGQGMGLGLAICHAIVTSHGGTITAVSSPGVGTTVRVELPGAPPA